MGSAPLRLYLTAVVGACLATLAALAPHGVQAIRTGPLLVWSLTGAVVATAALGGLPRFSRGSAQVDAVGLAVPCAFALQLVAGTPAAIVAFAVGGVAGRLWRPPLSRSVVAVAGPIVALATAGIALRLVAGGADVLSANAARFDVIAVVAGGSVLFTLVVVLNALSTALEQRIRIVQQLRQEASTHASTTAVLLALAPVVIVVAMGRPTLLPLLTLPVVAIYRNAHALLVKDHLAFHDALTSLPNRRLFLERLLLALQDAAESRHQVAVLLIDLDRFKEVNDQLGHHAGDLVLQAVAPIFRHGVAEDVTVARLGGDEFALCVPDVDGADEAVRLAKGIINRLATPLVIEGYRVDIGASIGIALAPDHGDDVSTVMQRADVAMYVAKENRGGFEVYAKERDPHRRQRVRSPSDLREATEKRQLVIHFQPKVEVATGAASGVEALVRWNHPTLGLIGPDEFIPLAERSGLMSQLTTYVLARSLEQCREWTDQGFDLHLAVNLSVQSLYDDAFPGLVAGLLERSDFDPACLVLDVTETTVTADPRRAKRVLTMLGAIGVTLAIDDFGTGYSSLAYLRQLPISELKIDKSFVLGMATDSDDAVIVHSAIDLAKKFGLKVVAEGVESRRVWDLLRRLKCDLAQGSFVCPPLPAEHLWPWLQTHASNMAAAASSPAGILQRG